MDLALHETGSGGSVQFVGGDLDMTNSLYNLIYICLFGGNVKQTTQETSGSSTSFSERFDWWGNEVAFNGKSENQYNSLFEKTVQSVTLNSNGRLRIEAAAKSDLKILEELGDISVVVSLLGNDSFHMFITVTESNKSSSQLFTLIWDSTKLELIEEQTV